MDNSRGKSTKEEPTRVHEPDVDTSERLRRVLDVAPGALVIADRNGVITQANRAAKDILGVPPESLIGTNIKNPPVRLLTVTGEDLAMKDNPMVRAFTHREDVLNQDLGVLTPLGELKFLLVSAVPLSDEHGCLAGAVSSFIDITDRKRAQKALEEVEKRQRLMLDNMRDIVFLIDLQGNIVYVTPSVETHLGWNPDEMMSGPSLRDTPGKYVHLDDREKLMESWKQTVEGRASDNEEFRAITKDGRIVWLSASWSPVLDQDGHVIAIQGSARDITDRVLARDARNRAEEEKRNFYKTTIAAFTGGRMQIVDEEETKAMTADPEVSIRISAPEDASEARSAVRKILQRHGICDECGENFVLAVGEAATNAIKHGQGGELLAGYNGEDVWVAVVDHGPGIETLALPRVTLEMGYSGKVSLGMGYSVIMDMVDRLWLSTSKDGTTVIMTCCAEARSPQEIIASLPDTW